MPKRQARRARRLDRNHDRHHRRPQAQGGAGSDDVVIVPKHLHRAWHALFNGFLDPHDIAKIINDTWLDSRYVLVVRRRHDPALHRRENVRARTVSHADV